MCIDAIAAFYYLTNVSDTDKGARGVSGVVSSDVRRALLSVSVCIGYYLSSALNKLQRNSEEDCRRLMCA